VTSRGLRVGVLVSGAGSNLGALIESVHGRSATFALERARAAGIESAVFPLAAYSGSTAERDGAMADWLAERNVALVVCAGFMGILSAGFLARFPDRILNLHPSLLPAFPGANAIEDAYAAGVAETGVTVHLVDDVLDGGPVVAQARLLVNYHENPEGLRARIHAAEHRLLPAVVEDVARGALDLDVIARKART
jgi:phosphoribosylglycinamide formyltransferase-1